MSIKPVDFNTILPKSLDLSSSKHGENLRNRNIVESGFIHQEKIIDRKQKKVSDVEKSVNLKVKDDSNSRKGRESKKDTRKRHNKPAKNDNPLGNINNKIDIRI